jgi:hypothetical protein
MVFKGFGGADIRVFAADNLTIQGNFFGLNADGTAPSGPSTEQGIFLSGSSNTYIGGLQPGMRNIFATPNTGVTFFGTPTAGAAANNQVQGNFFNINPAGAIASPQATTGILIQYLSTDLGATGNTIGGTTPEARNFFAGYANGLILDGPGVSGNTVLGNSIGFDITGNNPLPVGTGIFIENGAANTTIGGTAPGAGNIIRFTGNGVALFRGDGVDLPAGTGNAIQDNTFEGDGSPPIDLQGGDENANGETANDPGDADTGPNNLQNNPVLTSATQQAGQTFVSGTYNGAANATVTIQVYGISGDFTMTPLGTFTVTTGADGSAVFTNQMVQTPPPNGNALAATATDAGGNTSEFGNLLILDMSMEDKQAKVDRLTGEVQAAEDKLAADSDAYKTAAANAKQAAAEQDAMDKAAIEADRAKIEADLKANADLSVIAADKLKLDEDKALRKQHKAEARAKGKAAKAAFNALAEQDKAQIHDLRKQLNEAKRELRKGK